MDAFLVHMFTPDQISLASQPLILQGYAAYLYQIIVIIIINFITNTGTDHYYSVGFDLCTSLNLPMISITSTVKML